MEEEHKTLEYKETLKIDLKNIAPKKTYVEKNINPAPMGYISVVIPSVKVNRTEEVIGNPKYILLWF